MSQFVFANFLETELLDDISTAATLLHITPTMAARLPEFEAVDEMEARLVLWDGVNLPEIVGVTENPQTGYLTITRGLEGTSSRPWAAGTQVICSLTEDIINAALLAYFDIGEVLALNFLKLAGGTLTGPLLLAGDPTLANHAANKNYVDNILGNKLPLAGGTMLGAINMNANRILNLPAAASQNEPARSVDLTTAQTAITKTFADRSGILTTAGTSSAFTVTDQAGETALADGMTITVRMHAANSAGATLALNATAAKPIRVVLGQSIPDHLLQQGLPYTFVYDLAADSWLLVGAARNVARNRAGDFKWSALEADHDDALLCDGRSLLRTDYPTLFAAIGTKFGAVDGTHFTLPLGANKTLVGRDTNNTGAVTVNLTTVNTSTGATAASASGLAIGMYVNAAGVPAGTTLVSINTTTLAVVLSAAATASATVSARFSVLSDPAVTGASGGQITHTQVEQEVAQHKHGVFLNDPGHTHPVGSGQGSIAISTGGGAPVTLATTAGGNTTSNTTGITVRDTTGGGGTANQTANPLLATVPTPNMQPSLVANLFIYAY